MVMASLVPRYTAAAVRRFPDDGLRYEVIRGELFVSPAPGTPHQRLVTELVALLHEYVDTHGLGEVLPGPFEVEFARDTAVQPDVLVLLPERRAHKADDLVSLLLRVEEEGDVLSGEELLAQCTLLLVAGHETTRNLLGNGLLALLQNPDQLAKLKQNPTLINSAVRELARFDSPVQFSGRAATEDFSWYDQEIRKGQTVILLLASANRDPAKFSEPEKLEITRDEGMPLSFGHGTHFCIGAALAYTEAEIAFTTLLDRTSEMRLLDDVPAWRSNLSFRGLSQLPLSIERWRL